VTVLVATDLDGTVLFSERAMAPTPPDPARLTPVDVVDSRVYAYMTDTVLAEWARLAAAGAIVPATTRSVPQYERLRLPGPPPRFAVVCNGGRLLVSGSSDAGWERRVRAALAAAGVPYDEVRRRCERWHAEHPSASLRTVEDFFLYFTVKVRDRWLTSFAAEVGAWCRGHGWRASLQGRKLYLLPAALDKAPAVAEVAARTGAARIVAGGDSLLDAEMLRAADAAIRPAHGELHVTGFSAPNCRTTTGRGAAAGDEIMQWYRGQAGTHEVAAIA
jgi:hydroxymethylpyrimidine pyrophosphatase-like HAD family hydrolase